MKLLFGVLFIATIPCSAADPSSVSAARCRKKFIAGSASQYVGHAPWQDQGDGTIAGSTEERAIGQSVMTCVVKLHGPTTSAVLDFGGARISFTGEKTAGGLDVTAYHQKTTPVCRLSAMRLSGEDWIELGPARYALDFDRPVDRIVLAVTLTDVSAASSVRVDLNSLSIRSRRDGETAASCPPAVR